MKLFIVTSIKECKEDVTQLFKKAKIGAFSSLDVTGSKGMNGIDISDEWFASGDADFDSMVQFSFTTDENAQHALELVKEYNILKESEYPIRAFVLAVENSSH